LHVNFLPAADGDSIIAKAKVVQLGKSICLASVEVFTVQEGDERLCAPCTITLRNVEVPARLIGA
jgi:acyl-coenzyme A thioesterase PaaI-like protein